MDERLPFPNENTETGRGRLRETLRGLGTGSNFLSRTPTALQLALRMTKWDDMKRRMFSTAKEPNQSQNDDKAYSMKENIYFTKGISI